MDAGAASRFTFQHKLAAFAREKGVGSADVANAWVASHPAVTSVIVGISSVQQLDANLKAADLTLTPQERETVSRFFPTEVTEETGGKFPGFTTPDPTYHGVVYADLGAPAYALKARVQLLRDLGPAISPFNAFLVVQGIETLSLRIERHVQNAQRVAEWLEAHDAVDSVNYPGLPSSKWHAAAQKYAPRGAGAVLTFELHGGREAGQKFVEALELHSHVANIGDVRSLVIHPASTTHSQLTADEKLRTKADWFSDPSRIHREALGMRWLNKLVSGSVPEVVFEDFDHHVLAMKGGQQQHAKEWVGVQLALFQFFFGQVLVGILAGQHLL